MKKAIKTFILMFMMIFVAAMGTYREVHATGEANPRLLVESYTITDDEIVPGKEFELTMKIRNTSIYYDTYSVVVTVSDATGSVFPVYGSSDQRYIERVYARNSWDITIPLKAAENIDMATIPLKVTITYNDNYYIEKQKNDTMINLPVRLSGDLNLVSCTVPETVSQGTKARISATYENTGSKNLYNVVMKVFAGENEEPITTTLYSIGGGKKNTTEMYMDCVETGDVPVNILFTYEDELGEVFQTDEYSYNIVVTEAGESEFDEGEVVIVGGQINSITYILMAAIVIIAILILFIIKRKRR